MMYYENFFKASKSIIWTSHYSDIQKDLDIEIMYVKQDSLIFTYPKIDVAALK